MVYPEKTCCDSQDSDERQHGAAELESLRQVSPHCETENWWIRFSVLGLESEVNDAESRLLSLFRRKSRFTSRTVLPPTFFFQISLCIFVLALAACIFMLALAACSGRLSRFVFLQWDQTSTYLRVPGRSAATETLDDEFFSLLSTCRKKNYIKSFSKVFSRWSPRTCGSVYKRLNQHGDLETSEHQNFTVKFFLKCSAHFSNTLSFISQLCQTVEIKQKQFVIVFFSFSP